MGAKECYLITDGKFIDGVTIDRDIWYQLGMYEKLTQLQQKR